MGRSPPNSVDGHGMPAGTLEKKKRWFGGVLTLGITGKIFVGPFAGLPGQQQRPAVH